MSNCKVFATKILNLYDIPTSSTLLFKIQQGVQVSMKLNSFWRNQSIGSKYGIVFTIVMLAFILSVAITYSLLANTNSSINDTRDKNEVVIEVSELVSLYQDKYLYIPEYIIAEENERLLGYLSLSDQFVDTAKSIRTKLTSNEQIETFNQIIENNHALDEYYFSEIVPKVQNINTEEFIALQAEAGTLKEETMQLASLLKQEAIDSNINSIEEAEQSISTTITTLLLSIIVSFAISVTLIYFISRNIRRSLQQVVATSDAIANGNLNVDNLNDNSKSEIGQLSSSVNYMKSNLKEMINEIASLAMTVDTHVEAFTTHSADVKEGSEQVALTIEELANGATNQADEASVISEKTKEFSNRVISANENGEKLVQFSKDVLNVSIDGDKQMKQSLVHMDTITNTVQDSVIKVKDLENQTTSISEFVNVIRSIADQTNLLALNASIEAARAGESGKGFAVVAEEVRKLAEEVGSSSESITKIVDDIKNQITIMAKELNSGFNEVNIGKQQIETSGQYFFDIKEKVTTMSNQVNDISTTLAYFNVASDEINSSIEHIAAISEESAAGSEEISASVLEQREAIEQVSDGALELRQLVERMNTLISRFHI